MEIIALCIIVAAVITAEIFIYSRFGLRGLEYSVSLSKSEAFEGDEIEIIERVSNNKRLPMPWLKAEIATSEWLDFAGTSADIKSGLRFVPSVFMLKPHQKCTRRWKVRCVRRGSFSLSDTSVSITDIFGFVHASVHIPVSESITVLPLPTEIYPAELSKTELYGDRAVRRFICEDPFVISGAKEYSGREPMNRIHWAATARQGKLMAMSSDYTTDNTLLIMLNTERETAARLVPIHETTLEDFIHTAAYWVEFARKNRIRTGFLSSDLPTYLTPDSTEAHYLNILRALSGMAPVCSFTLAGAAADVDMSVYSDIVIITRIISPRTGAMAEALRRNGKNVIFCTPQLENSDFSCCRVGHKEFIKPSEQNIQNNKKISSKSGDGAKKRKAAKSDKSDKSEISSAAEGLGTEAAQ